MSSERLKKRELIIVTGFLVLDLRSVTYGP
jgi:hypothetical protein